MRAERRAVSLPALAALALVLSTSSRAAAFCRTTTVSTGELGPDGCAAEGHRLYWKSSCTSYRINEAASRQFSYASVSGVLKQAFAAWTNPGQVCFPSIDVVQLAPTTSTTLGYDTNGPNENIVVFNDEGWGDTATSLERETSTYDHATGEILDVDIEVNTAIGYQIADPPGDPNLFDLRAVMTHAAGHFLGLGHSLDPNAIMFAQSTPGVAPLPLVKSDDAAGICAIYPDGKRTSTDSSGNPIDIEPTVCNLSAASSACGQISIDHGCSASGRPPGRSSGLAPWLAGLALVLWRRRAANRPSAILRGWIRRNSAPRTRYRR